MAYTKMSVIAPSSASVNEEVIVQLGITNNAGYTIQAEAIIDVDGSRAEGSYESVTPGQTRYWYFKFTMPNRSVVVKGESWCESGYFTWRLDDYIYHNVSLKEVSAEFSEFGVSSFSKV